VSGVDEQREHRLRLRRIVARWELGEISLSEKRHLIDEENDRFYRGKVPKGLQPRMPQDTPPDVLADMVGVSRDIAERALNARRAGYAAADTVADKQTAAELRARGNEMAQRILRDRDGQVVRDEPATYRRSRAPRLQGRASADLVAGDDTAA
jgi:hypothetical protein